MEEESSPERLLVASGVKKEKTPLEEMLEIRGQMNSSVEKLMNKAEKAVLSAQETQRATDEMFQELQKYCSEKVPAQMVKALDAMAQEGFQKGIAPLSLTFEDVCRSFVKKGFLEGRRFQQVGRWWTKDAEIDQVGLNEEENEILLGEVKWSVNQIGTDSLAELKRKAPQVQWGREGRRESFALFSRSGFTEELVRVAAAEGVCLRCLEEIAA